MNSTTKKRLIDAKALENQIKQAFEDTNPYAMGMMLRWIRKQTKVDAVEVVHGRWLDVQETDMYVPDMKFTITKTAETCSKCKARIGFVGAKRYLFDSVCPNCSAKMDGGNEDGNSL